ncbi:MAG: hypothetical protein JWQ88_1147, partial [Rhodoferax sp.]|nr:hypothetical protein [Rhodoferax sp.]
MSRFTSDPSRRLLLGALSLSSLAISLALPLQA